jgi:hypothetical protein
MEAKSGFFKTKDKVLCKQVLPGAVIHIIIMFMEI